MDSDRIKVARDLKRPFSDPAGNARSHAAGADLERAKVVELRPRTGATNEYYRDEHKQR